MAIAFDKAASGSASITVPSGGVAAGNLVVVSTAVGLSTTALLTSLVDTRGNSYTISGTYRTITGASGGRSKYAYCILGTALQAGDAITPTWDGGVPIAGFSSYSGIAATSPLDQSSYAEQAGFPETTTLSTGTSGTTAQADEVVLGLFACVEAGGADVTWTPTASFNQRVDANAASNLACVYVEDRIVSAVGAFSSAPVPGQDVYYMGQLLTFKADVGATTPATFVMPHRVI